MKGRKIQTVEGIFTKFAILILGFIFSLHFSSAYTGGDQKFYSALYESLINAHIIDVKFLQNNHTGSSEPLYGYLTWIGAQIFEKNIWFSFFNSALLLVISILLSRINVSRYLFPLIFTNYYLFVVMFSAERLKFALIVIALSLILPVRWRLIFASTSILFHFQAILFASGLLGGVVEKTIRPLLRLKIQISPLISIFSGGVFISLLFLHFNDEILHKFGSYSGDGVEELFRFSIFFLTAAFISSGNLKILVTYFFLGLATFTLGDDRVNMVTFIFTIYYSFSWNRGINPVTIIFLSYFSIRGIYFLIDVNNIGTGFPQDLFLG